MNQDYESFWKLNKIMTINPQKSYRVSIAIIVAGVLIAGAVTYSSSGKDSSLSGGQPHNSIVDIANVGIENEPFIGNPDAPVTLAYWSDFQCPFCKSFDLGTLPTLVKNYVETGKLRVVFKDFQFLGQDSQTAGLASKAVWELYPDHYYAWHQAMYEAQDQEHGGFGDKQSIISLTRTIQGIDADAIANLMDQRHTIYQAEQDDDKREGAQFGINGTPGFVLGTQTLAGAQPISVFTQLIDAQLNK